MFIKSPYHDFIAIQKGNTLEIRNREQHEKDIILIVAIPKTWGKEWLWEVVGNGIRVW